jgi:hypothetical protein
MRQSHMVEATNLPRLQEGSKLSQSSKKPYQTELEMEKQTVQSNGQSTVASSTANGIDQLEIPGDDILATEEKASGEPVKAVEYPKGLQMFFIMLTLVLSITLCAMDQVRLAAKSASQTCFMPMYHTLVR